MVCRNCGRNNPEGQVNCCFCGMPLSRDVTVQPPTPYYGQAYPMPGSSGSQSAGFFTGTGERNVPGIIAAVLFALSIFPVYLSVNLTFLGTTIASQTGRLVNHTPCLAVLAIAVFSGIMAYIGNSKALTGGGVLAVAYMIYKALTVEKAANEMRDAMIERLSAYDYEKVVSVSIQKGFGFWMLMLTAVSLLVVGIAGILMEGHDPLSD